MNIPHTFGSQINIQQITNLQGVTARLALINVQEIINIQGGNEAKNFMWQRIFQKIILLSSVWSVSVMRQDFENC